MTDTDTARPTLAAVAARAGVSASTASLAFSGSGPVSDATREKVLDAARALNYGGPDPRARSLRRGRSGIVGVVIEERVSEAFHDPIKIAMLDGLAEELGAIDAGLLVLADVGTSTQGSTIADAPMDAVVLLGCSPRYAQSLDLLRSRGIPIVAIEGNPGDDIPQIAQDNRDATRRTAEHLRDLGHERVAVITLPMGGDRSRGAVTSARVAASAVSTAVERLAGVWDVYPGAPGVVTLGSRVEEGTIAAHALLAGGADERPTAIVAQSDLLAAGVIRAAEELGIAVPAELSVVGFDGVRVDGLWPYDLTTMVQPAIEKGRAAGRTVLQMLAGEHPEPATFTSQFHLGKTTAPPAA